MPRKRHKPEEIVAKLRQVDVLVSQGQSVAEADNMPGDNPSRMGGRRGDSPSRARIVRAPVAPVWPVESSSVEMKPVAKEDVRASRPATDRSPLSRDGATKLRASIAQISVKSDIANTRAEASPRT